MAYDPYKALYIHIPFCVSRCAYCDFATRAVAADSAEVAAYVEDLVMQIRRAGKEGKLAEVETVYIGGGTPTHVGSRALSQLLYTLGVSMHLTPEVECTVECNPESLDERLVRDMWALGANRLSIGVQSFDDRLLRTLGRAHDADGARRAIAAAQARFENVSIDLMCGLPGQTTRDFRASVEEAASLGVTHVSVYPLTIEEHTPFERMVARGEIDEPDDDAEAEHMQVAAEALSRAGFRRYEVASYARPGFESRHNAAYWTGKPYLGLGASAATMTQNAERRTRVQDGHVTDDLDAAQMAAEDLMLGMRMTRGVADAQVEAARVLLPQVEGVFAALERDGYVRHADGRWQPTEQGWLCGNDLYGRIFDLAP
ncbi:MAG: radical SAM family heme chaperone HemW [Eggerthellaceae bacterium]|nr:radical SAM family heme chaperone HemW [Eggerthellaceae bacterium]